MLKHDSLRYTYGLLQYQKCGRTYREMCIRDRCNFGHMSRSGEAGFDLYVKEKGYHLLANFRPEFKEDKIETELDLPSRGKLTEYMLYFPLYAGVRTIEIGLTRGSKVLSPSEHKVEKPVLFYGSSITQGGCASRPGSCYPAIVCRALEAPMVNLGFSGQAKGDLSLAKLIGSLSPVSYTHLKAHPLQQEFQHLSVLSVGIKPLQA